MNAPDDSEVLFLYDTISILLIYYYPTTLLLYYTTLLHYYYTITLLYYFTILHYYLTHLLLLLHYPSFHTPGAQGLLGPCGQDDLLGGRRAACDGGLRAGG